MRKLLYSLLIPAVIGVLGGWIVLQLFPDLLHPSVTVNKTVSGDRTNANGPASYADAVNTAAPAVVNIYTSTLVKQPPKQSQNPLMRLLPGMQDAPPKERLERSLGSGVIVSSNGYLLTNYHVIANATEIVVALRDGRESNAKIIGIDPDTDLAVLKIDLKNLPAITMAASDDARIGDVVLAIGNPFGVGQTVTMGIISATGRHDLGLNTYEDFIQTDAAINQGNSGGALVDSFGNLVGICTALFSENGGSQGIGFAIPSKLASSVLQEIITHGSVTRGWLGLSVITMSEEQLQQKNVQLSQGGLLVTELTPNAPAAKAGLIPGDLILAVDGQSAENGRNILNLIAQTQPGKTVTITVWRNQAVIELEAKIARKPII